MGTIGKVLAAGVFLSAAIIGGLGAAADTSWSNSISHLQERILGLFGEDSVADSAASSNAFWPATISKFDHKVLGRPALYIAHAGGGYQKSTYTNSIDALTQTYREGIRFFEIDFMRTKDGKIVCIHDWRNGYLTFEEFKKRQNDPANFLMKFNNCDLDSLGEFLAARADASLILDTKIDEEKENREDAVPFFKEITGYLTEKYRISMDRLVPQAYSFDQVKQYKAAGYPSVIFTVYKVKGPKEFAQACRLGGVAITAPVNWIIDGRVKANASNSSENCPIFVHPVDNTDQLAEAMKIAPQIRGIYTSFLRP
jgi:glycerophosphoryl diester phosphodiesterase